MDIAGKTAIVTGGGSGFGLGITKALLERGAKVAVFDISEECLAAVGQKYENILPVRCDVSDPERVDHAVGEVFDYLGSASILVNNAGIMKSAPLVNIMKKDKGRRHSVELWQKVLDVNLSSAFYMTAAVVDRLLLLREPGVIVNMSSISARGNAGQSAYAASKAGIEALTKVWAKELGPMGIRTGAVAPGFCDTSGAEEALEASLLEKWVEQTPLRRQGSIIEVVSAVIFVLENDYFNGEILAVNGGLQI